MSIINPNAKVGAYLKQVPLLAKLNDEDRAKLGGALVTKVFKDGQTIIAQGRVGHGFFIIMSGKATVSRSDAGKEPVELATLGEGDFFGEQALLNKTPRAATVKAKGFVECYYLEEKRFARLFGKDKLNVTFAKRVGISAESAANAAKEAAGDKGGEVTPIPAGAVTEKTPGQRRLLDAAVKNNLLFQNLGQEHKDMVFEQMYRVNVDAGTAIITEGDVGNHFYVVEAGSFDVLVKGNKVARRGAGTCFGELALMYNAPRAATVQASAEAMVWCVDRFTFRRIVTNLTKQKFNDYVQFLKSVSLLSPLVEYERKKIAEALEECQYSADEVIFEEGQQGDEMFLVQSGEVVITKGGTELMRCAHGDYFGERALLKGEARAATITAVTDVELLKLDRNAFALLLGPLENILRKQVASYEKGSEEEKKDTGADDAANKLKAATLDDFTDKSIKKSDLRVLGTLGKGSFGHVQLVRDVSNKKTYALKSVSKQQIVETGQQGHIMSEKRVMAAMNHPFLIRLYATFKDQDQLYFLLEPSLGGELFSVLRQRTFFDEDTARFFAASVVECFEYMHSKNIVYRDLKPENLLLNGEGFLKITDFGFAKELTGRTFTLCGTPDYLAPEIVAGKGHGKGVDWWTLGILIYEMLASYPPFYDEDPMKTYSKIMRGKITFPSHFSQGASSIVKKLLNHKPTKRLGVIKGGAKLIKKHAWFKTFSFENLLAMKMTPPIKPDIKNDEDISNFDDYPPEEDEPIAAYHDDGTNWDDGF
jgi:cGMP-dependent protein kinase